MTSRRWSIGGYQCTYNPSDDSRGLKGTSSPSILANGLVTANNEFFDKSINLTIDLYDKPTYLGARTVKSFTTNLYSSITEKKVTGDIFASKGTSVDVITKATGTTSRTFTANLASGSAITGLCHMDDRLGVFYANGNLIICDENGLQISKYTYVDPDIIAINSIAFDYNGSIYGLNKYGKLFKFTVSSGASTLLYQSSDFSYNQTNNLSLYKCLHYADGYLGFIWGSNLTYMNPNIEICYSTECTIPISSISFGAFSKEYYAMQTDKINDFYPNTCGVDIDKIKRQIANGITIVTDDNMSTINTMFKGINVKRLRNKQDSRYQVSLDGIVL
jgi:hypothetical protein